MIDDCDRLLILRQVDPHHRAATPQQLRSRSRRAFRRRSPRVAPLPLSQDVLLIDRDPDTKPGLSHQEDVPTSIASRRTAASSALSDYYAQGCRDLSLAIHRPRVLPAPGSA